MNNHLETRGRNLIKEQIAPCATRAEAVVWKLVLDDARGEAHVLAFEICQALCKAGFTSYGEYLKAGNESEKLQEFYHHWSSIQAGINRKLADLASEGIAAEIRWATNSKRLKFKRQLVLSLNSCEKTGPLTEFRWKISSDPVESKVVDANVPVIAQSPLQESRITYSWAAGDWMPPVESGAAGVNAQQWAAHVDKSWCKYCERVLEVKSDHETFTSVESLIERPTICSVLRYRHPSDSLSAIEFQIARASFKEWVATSDSLNMSFDNRRTVRDVLLDAGSQHKSSTPSTWYSHFLPAVNALHVLVHVVSKDGYLIARQVAHSRSRWQASIQGFVDPILDTNRVDPYFPDHRESAFRLGRELLGQAISFTQIRWAGVCMGKLTGHVFVLGSCTLNFTAEQIIGIAKRHNSARQRACDFKQIKFNRKDIAAFVTSKCADGRPVTSVAFEVGAAISLNRREAVQLDARSLPDQAQHISFHPVDQKPHSNRKKA